ncbi:MAG TPA: CBS domain-containing protein, partial [Desulfurivibrionaceae bacterium]
GSLGERLKVNVAEVMLTGAAIPKVPQTATLPEAIAELNAKNLGAVLVMQDATITGILTDGDLRRFISQKGGDLSGLTLAETITKAPKAITTDLLAADALSIMQRHEITFLAVTDRNGKLAGVLHLQDLLGKGEFRFLV